MARNHVGGDEEDEHNELPPPSYAEATGSSASLPINGQQSGYVDEKERLRHSLRSTSSPSIPPYPATGMLELVVDFKKPMLDFWTLNITPLELLPELSYWQLRYSTRYKATMRRHAPEPQSNFPLREVAEIKFPENVKPDCGPLITFWPHEEEIERAGLRHVSATERYMHCSGWVAIKFALDLPALGGSRVVWMVPKGRETTKDSEQEANVERNPSTSEKAPDEPSSKDRRRSTVKSLSWTPFPTQHLVEEWSNRIVATYTRAAPWSKHQGYLTILPSERGLTAEIIEGIVIATAAMVGMQDAIGMASSLIESGFDSVRNKGKGKSKDIG
ncbi:hypothetical protein M409DRAFT_19963 [Zasmidium cellare ATCC 36951]|uniref:Uncharacterized protein n=1 Tax=Zasmidium cellare ATCC 36951 TaxID=1080233 RepID=A0A6A6CR45_ZASCE|nr:uncharacterized protein M409DRAFT_19963 [Zasmidium cellare ATCC 36951]KAF2169551.1 hypothetical protein M409DRAFT_19963 [Zasmidium cellare ATCC 36951]